jgi:hypothetical protein
MTAYASPSQPHCPVLSYSTSVFWFGFEPGAPANALGAEVVALVTAKLSLVDRPAICVTALCRRDACVVVFGDFGSTALGGGGGAGNVRWMLEAKFNCAWAAEIEPHVASNAHATVASTDGKRNDLLDPGVIMRVPLAR